MEDLAVKGARSNFRIAHAMVQEEDRPPLKRKDVNVTTSKAAKSMEDQRSRNTWTNARKYALLNQICVESCDPFKVDANRDQRKKAWEALVASLREHTDGLFAEFELSIDSVQRRVAMLAREARKWNEDARASTGRGGGYAHTEVEELQQRLVEKIDERAAASKAVRDELALRRARLTEQGRNNVRRQMETHRQTAKRGRSSMSKGNDGALCAEVEDTRKSMDDICDLTRKALLHATRSNARAEWAREFELHKRFPNDFPSPGPRDEWVAAAVNTFEEENGSLLRRSSSRPSTISSEMEEVVVNEAT